MANILALPPWPDDAAQAIAMQKALANQVCLADKHDNLTTICGVDCSYNIQSNMSFAVAVVMRLDALKPLQIARAQMPTRFPYIPGLLSFREIPVIMAALQQLAALPDVIMVDGQGVAHPRRLGIAAHLGVMLNHPALGVAKSRLFGHYQMPGPHKGDLSPLLNNGERIGTVLRSKNGTTPLFISPGHRLSHETAIRLTMQCLVKHRLPEPTRMADKIAQEKPGKDGAPQLSV